MKKDASESTGIDMGYQDTEVRLMQNGWSVINVSLWKEGKYIVHWQIDLPKSVLMLVDMLCQPVNHQTRNKEDK